MKGLAEQFYFIWFKLSHFSKISVVVLAMLKCPLVELLCQTDLGSCPTCNMHLKPQGTYYSSTCTRLTHIQYRTQNSESFISYCIYQMKDIRKTEYIHTWHRSIRLVPSIFLLLDPCMRAACTVYGICTYDILYPCDLTKQ